jgi:K(+)-stimulated pyrophosphate-energized sodium pump
MLLALAALVSLLPTSALAAGGENVVLNFQGTDWWYLGFSLAFGILALFAAWWFARGVMQASPGSEKMQEVGLAIREGAQAYLKKQIATMSVFVLVLAVGLAFLFAGRFSPIIGFWIAVSFIGGVAASYIAGYTGMMMAVNANMRTAHAALTSYKRSLEVAFRSGAVAGMVTVGMGLIGATLILMLAQADAMKLLIGFGFGGSLAALFMRVGGGIFTKAADVGADLVGKVEAGIPEDDPRNPATIADNVGDNVGDCAGMAADIFESYEVTLVAAIVLGAATAAIFDQATWMRLILFALMARGVGIFASFLGIIMVRGSDDIDMDPLRAIRKGFYASAGFALVATLVLAFIMMGGSLGGFQPSPTIQTTNLTHAEQFERREIDSVRAIRNRIASERDIPTWQITPEDIAQSPELEALNLPDQAQPGIVNAALQMPREGTPDPASLAGYQPVDLNNPALSVRGHALRLPPLEGQQDRILSVEEAVREGDFRVFHVQVIVPLPAQEGQPAPPPMEQKAWIGPVERRVLDFQISQAREFNPEANIEIQEEVPARLFYSSTGQLAWGVGPEVREPHRIQPMPISYYQESAETVRAAIEGGQAMPPAQPIPIGVEQRAIVPWFMFFAAVAFGIFMAFAIEYLTDYYVSTHKRPTQEVAAVSSAGPAPMIIQGFAYAKESSVFMVFALVVALIMPLFFFPPQAYGGYILSFYGVALVGLGLLATTGYVLAMDTFGPISDNAQGVYEMSGEGHDNEYGSKAVQRLDAAGNTTKALTKGFAIATAVVAAVALFHSYIEGAQLQGIGLRVDIPEIFLGLMIGAAAPYLFSAFSINAVGRASFQLINEVRRQFRSDPGIMAGTSKPDYGRCVAIVTQAAQKELLGPGVLAIALPMAVAFGFSIGKPPVEIGGQMFNLTGAQALGGFLAGSIVSGQLMAVLLANSGGMWDNAKKLVEDGLYGGKGSDAHKAAIVCDTVGDPFKDTAGPALNPLIKVMNLVALLMVPVIIDPYTDLTLGIITAVCVGALAFSIWWSKKGSMSTALVEAQALGEAADVVHSTPTIPPAVAKKKLTIEEPLEAPLTEEEGDR